MIDRQLKQQFSEVLTKVDELPVDYSDRQVLRFIAARTVRLGKTREDIPLRHFLEGVPGTNRCSVPRTTLLRALKRLEERSFIYRIRRKNSRGHVATEFEIDCTNILRQAMASKLKIPRKPLSPCFQLRSTMDLPLVHGGPSLVVEEEVVETKKKQNPLRSAGSAQELVNLAKERNRQVVERKAAKLSTTRSRDALRAAWAYACRQYHPELPAPPVTADMAGRFRQQTIKMLPTGDDLSDFVNWAVSQWFAIRQHFAWMNKPSVPHYPDLGWCSQHCVRLLVARSQIEAKYASDMQATEVSLLRGELHRAQVKLEDTTRGPEHFRRLAQTQRIRRAVPAVRDDFSLDLSDIPDLPPWEDIS